jgi:methionyl-tRNA synthetase
MFAIVTMPIMPESSERILAALNCTEAERAWPKAPIFDELSKIPPGREFVLTGLLFRRIADEEVAAWSEKFAGSGKGPTAPTKAG